MLTSWIFIIILLEFSKVFATISVSKIAVRIPHELDIGLVFDLTITNTNCGKERLKLSIISDGTCTVNLPGSKKMCDAGIAYGGYFGPIETGQTEVVSVIWPTVSLFNRVGSCPIVIVSTNFRNKTKRSKQKISFDTRFHVIDPQGHTFRKNKNYKDCNNWDLDYLKNCTPVDCEERYFGQRNYFNMTSQHCEMVPKCIFGEYYNIFTNECHDPKKFFTEEDKALIKAGKFFDDLVTSETENDKKGKVCQNKKPYNAENEELLATFNKYFGKRDVNENAAEEDNKNDVDEENSSYSASYWLVGLLNGFLLVFATLFVYFIICFVIFLIVSWLSRRRC